MSDETDDTLDDRLERLQRRAENFRELLKEGDEVTIALADGEMQVAESYRSQFERKYLEQILESSAGNVTHAARAARKNRRAFFALMKKYGIEAGQFHRDADA